MKNQLLLVLTGLLCLQCSLFRKDDPKPKLPPATQEGKGTFGCYVNGHPWVPAGKPSFFEPNLELVYNKNSNGGSFDLLAQRVKVESEGYINIVIFGLAKEGTYSIGINNEKEVIFIIGADGCEYESREKDVTATGSLTITRLDLKAKVIAGTFEFTMSKPGCGDTIKITEGRFDMPL